ncbi:hypothetical protein C9374_011524 [Naegleria lovaniensis]|uniref:Uncharacterized protein n=1 Tax=Naegleria lovaniensis TaxID=51637 RepID=A0AA88KRL9_NAELO|nr:uncharacterized protein C9374_011524 [Naegleria lovaniensis]KAG2392799.1 hypothetical protein C9374_011524 [Naegleria lovaniensis]
MSSRSLYDHHSYNHQQQLHENNHWQLLLESSLDEQNDHLKRQEEEHNFEKITFQHELNFILQTSFCCIQVERDELKCRESIALQMSNHPAQHSRDYDKVKQTFESVPSEWLCEHFMTFNQENNSPQLDVTKTTTFQNCHFSTCIIYNNQDTTLRPNPHSLLHWFESNKSKTFKH